MVPLLRGMPQSRPAVDVIKEANALGDAGYREIVLTGTNLGTYSDGDIDLVKLIQQIESIPAIQRIRLSSIELTTIERKLVDYMASSSKLCRYLHVPLQTADDSLLKAMGRHYNSRQYRDFMEYAFNKIDELGFGTDVIVGLPGETRDAFENTVRFVSQLPFSNLHVFPYSKRPGTRADTMSKHVPECEKRLRVGIMRTLRTQKIETFAKKFIGKRLSVLVEEIKGKKAYGWSDQYIHCEINMCGASLSVNDIIWFMPAELNAGTLTGYV
jgi:threonylcarbamoyladenosine tRNA methylthiotransferase MtaB